MGASCSRGLGRRRCVPGNSYGPVSAKHGQTSWQCNDLEFFVCVCRLTPPLSQELALSQPLTLQVDETGKLRYDLLARQGHNESRIIHSSVDAVKPKDMTQTFEKPDDDTVRKTTEETRLAMEKLVSGNCGFVGGVMALTVQKKTNTRQNQVFPRHAKRREKLERGPPVHPLHARAAKRGAQLGCTTACDPHG